MICGECLGNKQIKAGKSKVTCPICVGTGENPDAYDSKNELITVGEMARILPQQIGTKENGEPVLSDGYKGKVRHITRGRKDSLVVTIMALPELSNAGQKTFNHGHRSAHPNQIRMLKSNANLKRLKQYKDKLAAAKEDECQN